MLNQPRAPGVYIIEKQTGARPIEAVGTSTAAFVGVAPKADAFVNVPTPVNNWTEFLNLFVPPQEPATNGGGQAANDTAEWHLAHAVYGFFLNGGTRCYVVNTGKKGSVQDALTALERVDEVAIVAAPGQADPIIYEAVLKHCEDLGDRVGILDAPKEIAPTQIDKLKEAAVVGADGKVEKDSGLRPRQSDGGYGTFYFPWILVANPFDPRQVITVAPSGFMAGIWARTDATRGVHKAPANEPIRGALNVTYRVTDGEQATLNPRGVNIIRFFPTEGIRVWGARTLAASSGEYRYLNVRRLVNMIKESIEESMRWVVFEPNDMTLWKSIQRDVGAFLLLLWRDGALMGAAPEQAFFVKCDAETNTKETIDLGYVVTVIGLAPVKPAEFVIFQISQSVAETQTNEAPEGG